MKFELDHAAGGRIIRSYEVGAFVIGEERVTGPVVLTADLLRSDLLPADIHQLTTDHLDAVCALRPDVLLIGTGKRQIFPPSALLATVLARGIGCEVMDTAAACRCHNVLLSESRSVATMLFPIEA